VIPRDTWYVRLQRRDGTWEHTFGDYATEIEAEQAARVELQFHWLTHQAAHISGWEGGDYIKGKHIELRDHPAGDLVGST